MTKKTLKKQKKTSHCQACQSGKYQHENSAASAACSFCPSGFEYVNTTHACKWCQFGKYQHEDAALSPSCAFCPTGFGYTSKPLPCKACASGMYQDESAQYNVSCRNCSAGTEFNEPNQVLKASGREVMVGRMGAQSSLESEWTGGDG